MILLNQMIKKINKQNGGRKVLNEAKGYTIIETMIAVSLFIVIIMAGMGALLNANMLHNKSQDMRSIMDSMSFVMEDMSRNLRTGYNYRCILPGDTSLPNPFLAKSCANGIGIAFEESGGIPGDNSDQWAYYVIGGKLYKSTDGAVTSVQLTPDEVVISSTYPFSILGAEPPPADNQQPFVIIKLEGSITFKNVVTPFSLQTSISQRSVDI
jgi:type II secretory pathway pseudopilin PulG